MAYKRQHMTMIPGTGAHMSSKPDLTMKIWMNNLTTLCLFPHLLNKDSRTQGSTVEAQMSC